MVPSLSLLVPIRRACPDGGQCYTPAAAKCHDARVVIDTTRRESLTLDLEVPRATGARRGGPDASFGRVRQGDRLADRHDTAGGVPVCVVIAEDQALLREGLARLFRDGGHAVVATLADADGVLETVRRATSSPSSTSPRPTTPTAASSPYSPTSTASTTPDRSGHGTRPIRSAHRRETRGCHRTPPETAPDLGASGVACRQRWLEVREPAVTNQRSTATRTATAADGPGTVRATSAPHAAGDGHGRPATDLASLRIPVL